MDGKKILKLFWPLLAVTALQVGCSKNKSSNPSTTTPPPGVDIGAYNTVVDPISLEYFNLPQPQDPSLINIENIPQGRYRLRKIETYSVSHVHQSAVATRHRLSNEGLMRTWDRTQFKVLSSPYHGGPYSLMAQLDLPLYFKSRHSRLSFSPEKQYRCEVTTNGEYHWDLFDRAHISVPNPSIVQTLKFLESTGVYSNSPHPSIHNTIWVTIDHRSTVNFYLRNRSQNETVYVHLKYRHSRL